jgi:hypothetical protein
LRCPFEAAEGSVPSDGTAEIEVRQLYELSDFPVGEDESGWREHEAEYREAHPTARPPEPGKKRFIIFRMADKDTEAEIAAAAANEAVFAAMDKYNQQMIDAGVMVAGEGLHPSSHGAKVYYHKGKRSVVDGPFTEAKELIAGFTMIEVASRDEAIAWVKRWPAIDAGGEVELQLRQVFGTEDFGPELPPEVRAEALSQGECDAIGREARAYREDLQTRGQLIAAQDVHLADSATTIRMRSGKLSIADGAARAPSGAVEQLGGFLLIEARDLNDAIRVASQAPPLQLGCIEVRPVRDCEARY